MFGLIEKWDTISWILYNIFSSIKFWCWDCFRFRKMLRRNKELKNKHKGGRCFIVLNGPSISNYDLTELENEIVICANFFYLSKYFDVVKPDYCCISDSDAFHGGLLERVHEMMKKYPDMKYILNKKAYKVLDAGEREKSYFVYGMHMPHLYRIKGDLTKNSSSFINVSAFCILCAVYMGFDKIYILGNDFAPGPMPHCFEEPEEFKYGKEVYRKKSRKELCAFHWYYYLAQVQSFYIEQYARNKNVCVYNLNPDSYIRAYDFEKYENIFKKTEQK